MLLLIGNLWIASIWAHEIVSNVIRLGEFSPSAWGVLSVLKKIIAMSWYEVALLLEANFFVRRKIIARVYFWWGVKTRNTWEKKINWDSALIKSPKWEVWTLAWLLDWLSENTLECTLSSFFNFSSEPLVVMLFEFIASRGKKSWPFFKLFSSSLRWTLTAVRQWFS